MYVSKTKCACCGTTMGEIEGGKIFFLGKGRSHFLKNAEYLCICGDCMVSADDDTDEALEQLEQDEIVVA